MTSPKWPQNEGEMSFELFGKYFDKNFDKQNKRMKSKLRCDAR